MAKIIDASPLIGRIVPIAAFQFDDDFHFMTPQMLPNIDLAILLIN